VNIRTVYDEKGQQVAHLKDALAVKDGELTRARTELERKMRKLRQTNIDLELKW
jgi:hypothetical protein